MSLRLIALLIAASTVSLAAHNVSTKPKDYSGIFETCQNYRIAPEKAISACSALIENQFISEDDRYVLLTKRSWAFRRSDEYENALSDIDRALEVQPKIAHAWVLRAYINDASGAKDAAAQDFAKALEVEPTNVSTLMNRAKLFYAREEYDLALGDYEHVRGLDPENYLAIQSTIGLVAV